MSVQERETSLCVSDFYVDRGDFDDDRALAFDDASTDAEAAKKTFLAEAEEAGVKVKYLLSVEFVEFDSSNMSHAGAHWNVKYEGDIFPEE